MASLGKRSQFAFPLGGDAASGGGGLPDVILSTDYHSVANGPGGIRFANLPLRLRGTLGITQGVLTKFSAPVSTTSTMAPADKAQFSGVVIGSVGSKNVYGKTPSSVLAKELRNTNAFGDVIFR